MQAQPPLRYRWADGAPEATAQYGGRAVAAAPHNVAAPERTSGRFLLLHGGHLCIIRRSRDQPELSGGREIAPRSPCRSLFCVANSCRNASGGPVCLECARPYFAATRFLPGHAFPLPMVPRLQTRSRTCSAAATLRCSTPPDPRIVRHASGSRTAPRNAIGNSVNRSDGPRCHRGHRAGAPSRRRLAHLAQSQKQSPGRQPNARS